MKSKIDRGNRLGRQIEKRERELRAEFEDDKKEGQAKRTFWITWGTIGAIIAAWFLLSR